MFKVINGDNSQTEKTIILVSGTNHIPYALRLALYALETVYKNYFKRLLDIVCSGLALIALSPILLVTAVLVRLKLGSPVFFTQQRPGLNEKIFKIYKLRTMTDERDKEIEYGKICY